jgi:CRISPR-associated protein Cmr2
MNYFHFTLGPVQGFVSQARRTRDFWAGSFLLSWLSGVAMAATEQMGGTITFPIPATGYLDWIRGNGKGEIPRQGSIPNRFKASVPDGFDGKLVEQAVRDAWMKLADHVWQQDLKAIASPATREVWDRQNAAFWEISWAITDDVNASNLLDRRKNWRNHLPPPEPGVKCVIMEGWQELSGVTAMRSDDNKTRAAFWNKVRAIKPAGESDFAEGEMLCALAFVKRRFARHFAGFKTTLVLGEKSLRLEGWQLETGMPSVAYMAAVRWLEKIVKHEKQEVVAQLLEVGKKLAGNDEWSVRIKCLHDAVDAVDKKGWSAEERQLIALDGNVFFEHTRANKNFYPNREDVKKFEDTLKSLDLTDKAPTPFYAVLMMDGDSLGTQMSSLDNQEKIATALNAFTKKVADVVQDNNGFLIYAGGDDVLALLPLEDALPCALACRNTYTEAFKGTGIATTLSGAVLYAHVKVALGEVLRQAHHVLDDVAKDGAGRDAIAIRVLKPGGDHLTWAQPWEIALNADKTKLKLQDLIDRFSIASDEDSQFSSKFFYRMRERFDAFKAPDKAQEKADKPEKSEDDELSQEQRFELLLAVLSADYKVSGVTNVKDIQQARADITPLLEQCFSVQRDKDEKNSAKWKRDKYPQADAALLVRFLAHKGVEIR